ncbi:polyketide synthase, putative [Talaromyces stipitatus ATCC 10500]|uniref:Polyketide synthase, putative n=1 Tax=Talaromyces stipitatus (strain ATCC 10500 / CBS 375.48 / QM 6759 / NRRL 1006) TaxID=441959 RepID=B8MQ32_TALSN|nr:polyketide synthase, putative [Talaromyces stipitatus ATCC 10500]EED13058.1 polyketide synthase, putative [Talaromyces stipitatus ATCC 10500]
MGSIAQDDGYHGNVVERSNLYPNGRLSSDLAEPIAIVGMAMRLPGGVRNDQDFWNFLVEKRSGLCEVPKDRYNVAGFCDPSGKPGTFKPEKAYFLQDVSIQEFDTSVFPITKTELERLDPQQRQLLEVAYECMENAGATSWRGTKIGCYVGVFGEDWQDLNAKETQHRGGYRVTGYGDFVLGNRVSYEFDLHGPSMTVKTGCSSSLVCLDMACEAIRKGDCDGSLVCGTSLIFSPTMTMALSDQGVLSPDGICKTFDASANGYGRGEAVNAIYIKKLSKAIEDGDVVRAVIRGTSVNTDGRTNGMLTPSPVAQEALIRQAYKQAGIKNMCETAFVECHGTGTPVGDPLETTAVAKCFGKEGVLITSVKPNVGHSEGAAGITSLIKSILAIEHRQVPPNIHFTTFNSKIPFESGKLRVPVDVEEWPRGRAERVSVNSFGIGGVNAHVVVESLEQYFRHNPICTKQTSLVTGPRLMSETADVQQLMLFSAHSETSLKEAIDQHRKYIEASDVHFQDIAYTLANRRDHAVRSHRAFAVAMKVNGKISFDVTGPTAVIEPVPRVGWIFTGQGAQWPEMGAELIDANSIFRNSIRGLDEFLASLPNPPSWTIEDELRKLPSCSRVSQAEFGHPLSIAVQIGLIDMLRAWNIKPDFVLGHSSGEMAAAYASGAISATAAMAAATFRGSTSSDERPGGKPRGGMAAIGLGAHEMDEFMEPGVVIACENSQCSVTISGDIDQVAIIVENVQKKRPGVLARFLRVEKAFHSHHMKEYGASYEKHLKPFVQSVDPIFPFYSSVTGKQLVGDGRLDPDYWRKNMESPVLFNTALRSALKSRKERMVLIEIGPHPALKGPIGQILRNINRNEISHVGTLQRGKICSDSILETAGNLFLQNIPLDWSVICPPGKIVRNLPQYSWKHDTSFWAENRLASQFRFREFLPHDLLGTRVVEVFNENCWRNKLALDDLPWLQGHEIDSQIVFPGAGYICIVGEAIRQLSGATSYTLNNVSITAGLILEHDKLVEIVTRLTPNAVESDETASYSFQITSYDGSRWTKHCSGEIKGFVDKSVSTEISDYPDLSRQVDANEWYTVLNRIGFNYKGFFRGLQQISASPVNMEAVATVPFVKDTRTHYAIHPGIIDQCFQLFTVAACRGLGRNCKNVAVPTFIEEMVVCPANLDMQVVAKINNVERGSFEGSLTAQGQGRLFLSLKGFKASAMTNSGDDESLPLITQFEWRPHADFIQMKDYMYPRTFIPHEWPMLEEMMLLAIIDHQEAIRLTENSPVHLEKLFKWIQDYIASYKAGGNIFLSKDMSYESMSREQRLNRIEHLAHELSSSHYDAFAIAIHRLFKKADQIFAGDAHALHILMEDDVLTRLYANGDELLYGDAIRALGHTNPRLRVLEVGAGTGGTTSKVLDALKTSYGERLYSSYTYTDVSAGFFTAAKERFADFEAIHYATFDISKDPEQQGFQKNSYDLIIGYNVVHATASLQESLGNLRSLLSPSGRIFLQELCPAAKYINYIMGFLSGWWLGDKDDRAVEPYISPERWSKELVAAGFKNPEYVLDGIYPYHQSAGIMATVSSQMEPPSNVSILCYEPKAPMVHELKTSLESQGISVTEIVFGQKLPSHDIISVLDMEKPTAHELNEQSFKSLVGNLQSIKSKIIWLLGSSQVKCEDPKAAMSIGLLRTARNEYSTSIYTLEIEKVASTPVVAKAVSDLLFHIQAHESKIDDVSQDWEYALINGKMLVPRLHWQTMSNAFDNVGGGSHKSSFKYLTIRTPGLLHTMGWAEDARKPLGEDEVRVTTKAIGLNFRDVLISLGVLNNSTREIGLEGCGVVAEVGAGVTKFAVGDRVMYMSSGCFTSEITLPQTLCVKICDFMTFEQGAAIPCVYATATMALVDKANIRPGQTVLIHSACGGVGLAAIQIAQMMGAMVYCTVSNEDKSKYLVENHNIPRANIFNSRDSSFVRDVMRMTNGRGVDVVLNSLSGDLLHASWKCVAEFGTMIEIGKRDFRRRAKLSMEAFEQNRTFVGLDLWQVSQVRPEQASELLERCIGWIQQGLLNVGAIAKVFDAIQIQDAFRFMQGGRHIGKIIITMPESTDVLQSVKQRPQPQIRSDRSYILVGGLGGLGRSLARWLAENGAGELIFLSRSAKPGTDVDVFKAELTSQGCSVQFVSGSVANAVDVQTAIKSATKPISGVVNLSMVLRDVTLQDMTFEDWVTAVTPKVQGTWNLHEALPTDLDFFILCSSYSGIVGQWGQANYAAANTFLDAFIQYRHEKGLAASVIDIGVMGEVGFVSKHKEVLDRFEKSGMRILKEQDLLDAFNLAIQSSAPTDSEIHCHNGDVGAYNSPGQILLGLVTTLPVTSPNNRVVWKNDIRMGIYHNINCAEDSSTKAMAEKDDIANLLSTASTSPSVLDEESATEIIAKTIAASLAKFLIKDESSIQLQLSPEKNGIDSLVAMELRNWIRQKFSIETSVMVIIQSSSLNSLADAIRQELVQRFSQS